MEKLQKKNFSKAQLYTRLVDSLKLYIFKDLRQILTSKTSALSSRRKISKVAFQIRPRRAVRRQDALAALVPSPPWRVFMRRVVNRKLTNNSLTGLFWFIGREHVFWGRHP